VLPIHAQTPVELIRAEREREFPKLDDLLCGALPATSGEVSDDPSTEDKANGGDKKTKYEHSCFLSAPCG
jgi:hypothetical protein